MTVKKIDTDELREKLESGAASVFDVRSDVEYERAHIPGAKTAPLGSLTFRVASLMKPDSLVVVYSNGPDCDLAAQAVGRLEKLGMKNVHCYEAGIKGWREAGLEVVESTKAKAHARGEVKDVRPLTVDRERAYGGAFKDEPDDSGGAGG